MSIEQKIENFFNNHTELLKSDPSYDLPHIPLLIHSFRVGDTMIDGIFQDADGVFRIESTYIPTASSYTFPLAQASQDIKKRLLYNLNKIKS